MKDNKDFINIFDMEDSEAERKKNFLYGIKNPKTDEWSEGFAKNFKYCYKDIVNKVYLRNNITNREAKDKMKINDSGMGFNVPIKLDNGQYLETCLANKKKLEKLKYLSKITGEEIYCNFNNLSNVNADRKTDNKEENIFRYIDSIDNEEVALGCMLRLSEKIDAELFDRDKAIEILNEIRNKQKPSLLEQLQHKTNKFSVEEIAQINRILKLDSTHM